MRKPLLAPQSRPEWLAGLALLTIVACGNANEGAGESGGSAGNGGNAGAGGGNASTGGLAGRTASGAFEGGSGADGNGFDANDGAAPSSPRVDVVVNARWTFTRADAVGAEAPLFNDAAWVTVNLPHSWNNLDGQNGPTTTPAYYRGIGWYRKHFTIPATMTGKRIYLQFDGSAYLTRVWVNGTEVGSHAGGYAAFRFDVTEAATVGADNVIAVKVDNSAAVSASYVAIPGATTADVAPRTGDFTFFGGMYRDVHVLATDPLAISPLDFGSSGVYLKPTNVSAASADLAVTVKLLNRNSADKTASVTVEIVDASGAVVQTLTGVQNVPANASADAVVNGAISNPHLWDGLADPYLYGARVTIKDGTNVTDVVQQPLGFRFFSFDPNTGFSLNGKPCPLRGIGMQQDHKDKGPAFSPSDIDDDFAIIKEMGANSVRFVNAQHASYVYDKADQLGVVGWAENSLGDSINDTIAFAANAKQQLTELIRQNFNHPSIVVWSLSNAILLRPSDPAGANILGLVSALNQLGHQEDPTRMTINSCAHDLQDDPVNWVADISAFQEYSGWFYDRVADFGAWADQKHGSYPSRLVAVGEYGAGTSVIQHDLPVVETGANRTSSLQTEEYAAFFHEQYWKMIAARPFLVWTGVTSLFDFASDYRNEGLLPGLTTKGLVSFDRAIKKDPFYFYKAQWSTVPFAYIASRRFTTMPHVAAEIRVYSNQPEVELTLNAASLGKKQATDHVFVWTGVTWAAGANIAKAAATSVAGATDQVTWTN